MKKTKQQILDHIKGRYQDLEEMLNWIENTNDGTFTDEEEREKVFNEYITRWTELKCLLKWIEG